MAQGGGGRVGEGWWRTALSLVKARRDTGVRFLGNHSRGEYAEHLGDVYVRAVDLPKSPLRASGARVA